MTVGGGVWCCGHCRERRGLFVEGVGHGCGGGGGGDGGWPWGVVIRGGGGAPFCSDVCCECLMLAACRRECVCVCVCIRVCVCARVRACVHCCAYLPVSQTGALALLTSYYFTCLVTKWLFFP